MTENNWKTLSIKEVYDNPWISITHREVIDPGGQPGIYGKVNFKNMAVGVVPIDDENNTWLVGQFRYTLNKYTWEIPEGGCPRDVLPLDAAKQELREETGIIANQWEPLLEIHTSNSVTNEYGIVYLAKDLTFGESEPESTEDLMVKKVPFDEVLRMVMDGEITDSISIAAIMKIKLLNIL